MQTRTVLKMTKLSDTSYQTESTVTMNGGTISTLATTKYLGPCTPEPLPVVKPSEPTPESIDLQRKFDEMKTGCENGSLPAQVCDAMLPQLATISQMSCGK
jgi:hypothetical protein